ncbi:MAG: hypothetical protein A3H99_05950 [Gallionellales bacterium RIFCSPLOWO2_02_FULL_59_110]|nr:MAG: hypothetical protein A3H99_05950 [Gallionellales bacterium RIFCSPLOWO2_02_FULL_59_110]
MGRGSDFTNHSKMREKSLYVTSAQVFRVALVVEVNIAFNPVSVGLFSANAIVLHPQLITDLIK